MEFLTAVENSGFGTWVRESPSLWAYPGILFLHTVGLSFLVGLNATIDLRLLGCVKRLPVAPMEGFYRVMWAAFVVNALTGTALLVANATTKATNPAFYFKMGFITLAMIDLVMLRRAAFRQPRETGVAPGSARVLAAASLLSWTGAIIAGRLMAYFGQG
ncbi:MAG: hypothetical protein WBD07_07660 [Vicinamibacterales bacterium]